MSDVKVAQARLQGLDELRPLLLEVFEAHEWTPLRDLPAEAVLAAAGILLCHYFATCVEQHAAAKTPEREALWNDAGRNAIETICFLGAFAATHTEDDDHRDRFERWREELVFRLTVQSPRPASTISMPYPFSGGAP